MAKQVTLCFIRTITLAILVSGKPLQAQTTTAIITPKQNYQKIVKQGRGYINKKKLDKGFVIALY